VWLEGLPEGEHTIRLELLTTEDALAPVPFNPTERTFEIVLKKAQAHHSG
jgi:hypothetical protein